MNNSRRGLCDQFRHKLPKSDATMLCEYIEGVIFRCASAHFQTLRHV